jgi:putative Holliday junction resolvase
VSTIIGLDHGARRIGIAIGDTETGMAFARRAIRRRRLETDLHAVADLARAEGADAIVVGLPLNMDGSEGKQAALARAFGVALAGLGMRVLYQDERLSSWEADRHFREAGRRPDRASGERDSTAARLILQEYLDARRRAVPPEETA